MKSISPRFADQRAGLGVGQPVVVEIAADAAAQIFGFADVNDRAVRVFVQIHAGQSRKLSGPIPELENFSDVSIFSLHARLE